MEQRLTVAVSSDSEADYLHDRLFSAFGSSDSGIGVNLIRRGRCFTDILFPKHVTGELSDRLKLTAAQMISDYIVDHLESEFLRKIVLNQFGPATNEDMEKIIEYCRQLLNESEANVEGRISTIGRRDCIRGELNTYICTRSFLDVNGFARFRLKNYMMDLKDTAEYAIDEFMLNKQYQEFIALLKYFVYFQDTKIPEAHLIHHGDNKFILLDGEMNPLDMTDAEEVVVETIDRELNYEDLIVSTLISASPKRIFIHTREPETQSIKTIQQIFEGRTCLCTCCKLCKQQLREWAVKDRLLT